MMESLLDDECANDKDGWRERRRSNQMKKMVMDV
jgi:hypothetical protein